MTPTLAQAAALFTAPALAAAGAAAVAIPIAIHLLWRLRRRPEPWGAMRFLQQAYRRHRSRLRFEQWLLLAVRCLIVLVLGLALAGPLLTGCAGRLGGALDARGRTVHLLIDDGLTSQATAPTGEPRLERLRQTALDLLDHLGPGDRVAVWRTGRPHRALVGEPTLDRAAVRTSIQTLQPRHGRSDLPAALASVNEAIDREGTAPGETIVVLLSDFARAADYLDEPAPAELRRLGDRAAVWALRPAAGVSNVQLAALRPLRRTIVVDPAVGTAVPVALELRRFDTDLPEATVGVDVALLNDAGEAIVQVQRDQRFAAGQSEATLNVSLPLESVNGDQQGARTLALRARLDPGRLYDAIAVDNTRYALVELRQQLRVALVDEPSFGNGDADEGLRPAQWLALALSPQTNVARGAVQAQFAAPADVNDATLADLDAALILRPDLLTDPAWAALARFAEAGGLVWVFAPPVDTAAVWAGAMQRAFGVAWRVGLEPLVVEAPSGAALDADAAAPEPMQLLAADWPALLRPVRVYRRLPLSAEPGDAWLRMSGEDAATGGALLAAQPVGQGALVLLAAPLDADWTNLPTRPLFVPLIHETLRGLLGSAGDAALHDVVAGDQPALGEAWRGAVALAPLWSDAAPIPLRPVDDGDALRPVDPLDEPAVYAAEAVARKLAVNVEADAGDVRAASEEQLARWLSGFGAWRFLDEADPAAVFAQTAEVVNLGWPLLWVVLGLVVLETVLARYLSHARQADRRTLGGYALRAMDYLRHREPQPDSDTADARGRAA